MSEHKTASQSFGLCKMLITNQMIEGKDLLAYVGMKMYKD